MPVYALVPRQSLEATLLHQALRQATRSVGRVEHTMALEAQVRRAEEVTEEVAEHAAELVRTMSPETWKDGDGG